MDQRDKAVEALREFLRDNDLEGFGCACTPVSKCGTCQWADRFAPLVAALAAVDAAPTLPADDILRRVWEAAGGYPHSFPSREASVLALVKQIHAVAATVSNPLSVLEGRAPAQPVRQPLPDDRIMDGYRPFARGEPFPAGANALHQAFIAGVRFAERHHGIASPSSTETPT